ncbi:MAG TPA: SMP-30/gluconolactonase/LRE family protein [Anaerolineae bacterium]|nr:SMP-30/gluconolactonase/LRE family protein [Anaerolineae bacterium]
MEPSIVAPCRCALGESPVWNPFDRRVYWTDIPQGRLYRYDPVADKHEVFFEGGVVGGLTLQADGSLLLFMERGAIKVWREGRLTAIVAEIPAERDTRFNDVSADPAGRVFCGTLAGETHPASLYRLDVDGALTPVIENVGMANGMGFTPDRTGMYFTDTLARKIERYAYAEQSGALSNPRRFVQVFEHEGSADGLAVDAEGGVWSARWGAGTIVRYTPDGREERRVQFPTLKITSLAFGGEDYRDVYVTSAGGDDSAADPAAGALFRLRSPIAGKPEFFSRIRL